MFLDGGASPIFAEFLQENYRKNLGAEVILTPISFEKRMEISMTKEFSALINPTGPDFDDPISVLEIWVKDHPYNEVNYNLSLIHILILLKSLYSIIWLSFST